MRPGESVHEIGVSKGGMEIEFDMPERVHEGQTDIYIYIYMCQVPRFPAPPAPPPWYGPPSRAQELSENNENQRF